MGDGAMERCSMLDGAKRREETGTRATGLVGRGQGRWARAMAMAMAMVDGR